MTSIQDNNRKWRSLKLRNPKYLLMLTLVFLTSFYILNESSIFSTSAWPPEEIPAEIPEEIPKEITKSSDSSQPTSLPIESDDTSVPESSSQPEPTPFAYLPPADYGTSYRDRIDNKGNYIVPKGPSPPGEKYIAYLPHNQFNNQRIALENAILLAHYTNRTLILPYVYFGRRNMWKHFDTLYAQNINNNTKEHLEHCVKYIGEVDKSKVPVECRRYDAWTTMPWDHLFGDLPDFFEREGVKVISTMNISIEWIMAKTGVNREDFHYFKDGVYYGAKIYDDPSSTTSRGRFRARLNLSDFMEIPHRVVYFESMYGIGRVAHEVKEHKEFFTRMIKSMTVTYDGVLPVADKIIAQLGGRQSYVGIHVRVSDGFFSRNRDANIKNIVRQINAFVNSSGSSFETSPSTDFTTTDECLTSYTNSTNMPLIYMATDLHGTRKHASYAPLYKAFPCIAVLDDFTPFLSGLDNIVNEVDKMPMKKFLIPLVDMVVAAKGKTFVGTARSTFSNFAFRLHKIYIEGMAAFEDSKIYAG
ncbi:11317_t:CDS:1 [Paraglomus occultum]|uniref:11317_t:CDS:1 n=1 Tax=Paraglomus occultum TaxID=144539 RepID=A0A9N9A8S9_9GLOM|nr:11317_t:CDS:1 [Paraglomus occultum]